MTTPVPWFIRDPGRLKQERKGLEELSQSTTWLIAYEWLVDGDFCLDAIIRAHEFDYEVRVYFPSLYPDVPSVVCPRNMKSRISQHQYGGADGPLCLEWGPDNWHRNITAVDMLHSAQKLFELENPSGREDAKRAIVAPSRHYLTIGQKNRTEWARWHSSSASRDFFVKQANSTSGGFKFSFRQLGETWVTLVHEATSPQGEIWKDISIPNNLQDAAANSLFTGIWFQTELDRDNIGIPNDLNALRIILEKYRGRELLKTDGSSPIDGFNRGISGVLISDNSGELHLFIVLSSDKVFRCSEIRSEALDISSRAPLYEKLSGKSVGIVGLGSAGSKIAVTLARMGIREFFLIDHDLFLPENLQRHTLDWQSVALHKVDAMKRNLHYINPQIKINTSQLHLTGQESNAAIGSVLRRLSESNLIIDATADPKVFNLLAAIARFAAKSMVWLEIYGGGIGGLVARSRPEQEPDPQSMRAAYHWFCENEDAPVLQAVSEAYAAESSDGEVIVASDADVAIIAHHAAQLALDCFVSAENSQYPYSMYLIGLKKGRVFEEPFTTIPIRCNFGQNRQKGTATESELDSEDIEFLCKVFQNKKDESSSAS